MTAPSQASSGVGGAGVKSGAGWGDSQFGPVGKPASRPSDRLGLKRPSPPRLGHQARANQGRLQSRAAAASRWISQSESRQALLIRQSPKEDPLSILPCELYMADTCHKYCHMTNTAFVKHDNGLIVSQYRDEVGSVIEEEFQAAAIQENADISKDNFLWQWRWQGLFIFITNCEVVCLW